MADDQQLKFTLIIDKATGAVKQVSSELDDVAKKSENIGKTSKEAGAKGEDAFKKLGTDVTKMATSLFIAQLALDGLKKVAEKNDAFQELQTVFEDTAKTILETLGPAITMISKGLSGLVTIIGGAAKALVSIAKGDFSKAGDIMAESIDRAAGIIDGTVKVITANMKEAAATQLAMQQAHLQATTSLRLAQADLEMQALHLTEDQKLAIIQEKHRIELDDLVKSQALKLQQIELDHQTNAITDQQYEAKKTALAQQGADARKAIDLKASGESQAIEREKTQKLEAFFKSQIQAGAAAAIARYQQTQNVGEAVRAAAGAEVAGLANYAAEYIAIQGAKAAAAAFFNAVASTPGPAGVVAGVAAATGTLAFYTGLAAIVGGAGAALGGAISGAPGGGGGTGDQHGGGPASAAGGGGDFANAPAGGVVAAPGSGGGQGAGLGAGVSVLVYLDGDVLFRAITNASRDGRIVITARNVVA